jgi:hypothetical protein
MAEVVVFPGERKPTGGSGGPDDPMLEQRVTRLEEDMREVKTALRSIENKLGSIEVSIARIEGRIGGIESRLQNLPTTWQTISILAVLLFGVAGIVFAAGNFIKP